MNGADVLQIFYRLRGRKLVVSKTFSRCIYIIYIITCQSMRNSCTYTWYVATWCPRDMRPSVNIPSIRLAVTIEDHREAIKYLSPFSARRWNTLYTILRSCNLDLHTWVNNLQYTIINSYLHSILDWDFVDLNTRNASFVLTRTDHSSGSPEFTPSPSDF